MTAMTEARLLQCPCMLCLPLLHALNAWQVLYL